MKGIDESIILDYKKQAKNAIEDLKTRGRRHRQIPNILTLMRLTAPCFILPAAAMGNIALVLGLTAFFSLTDFADGFIARNWKLTSELGEALDAVTDKVFASTLLLAASFANPVLLCNLGLEVVIAAINVYKKLNDLPAKSSFVGKVKTWFLFSLAGIGIVSSGLELANILSPLMVATTTMQVFTIGSYLSSVLINKELKLMIQDEIVSDIILNLEESESKELQKDKVLEIDSTTSKIQAVENESVKQLKAMRDYLESEQEFLRPNANKQIDSINIEKSKKDDFKKN